MDPAPSNAATGPLTPPAADECHVWLADLAARPPLDAAGAPITPAERDQAAAFVVDGARQLFLASRTLQRVIAGRYLGRDPDQVTIGRHCEHCGDPAHGRPRLSGDDTGGLDFSVTHSGRLVALAYVTAGRVGLDAEAAERTRDVAGLTRLTMTDAEAALLAAEPEERRPAAFRRLWSRKEAALKLTGHGLGAPLTEVDVSGDAAVPLGTPPAGWPTSPVRLLDLDLSGVLGAAGARYAAALARLGDHRVTIRPALEFLG